MPFTLVALRFHRSQYAHLAQVVRSIIFICWSRVIGRRTDGCWDSIMQFAAKHGWVMTEANDGTIGSEQRPPRNVMWALFVTSCLRTSGGQPLGRRPIISVYTNIHTRSGRYGF